MIDAGTWLVIYSYRADSESVKDGSTFVILPKAVSTDDLLNLLAEEVEPVNDKVFISNMVKVGKQNATI